MKNKLNIATLIGLVLGILMGIVFPNVMKEISFLGTIYINLLKFMIIPILFTSIIVSVYNTIIKKTKIIPKAILLFIIMFVISFLIMSLFTIIFKPGIGLNLRSEWDGETKALSVSETIINLFPSNISSIISNNSVFACIVVAFAFGITASKVNDGSKVIEIIDIFRNISNKILEYIIYLTPIGTFALIGNAVATYGYQMIGAYIKYILFAYIGCFLILFFVMILPVWFIAKITPLDYVKKICNVWIITVTTCSSVATLPYTMKVCNERFNIPEKITNIIVPLGCTINMCGGAASFALLGLFCAQMYGVSISLSLFVMMIVFSTLINMAAPGIPGGGIIIGTTYLSMLGIPLSFIGIYSSIYKILDMAYTTLNVTGDVTANILLNEHFKKYK